ncbi:STAS domain-containing protein [Nocardia brasiliensis]|uniref:Anti-sigma factor antagonist n=1 Tax=Nocardia brasiliensis (strain ATCC 700358 / HUJEG-1) TaxID=1133849 RepID=K0ERT9_NOCB7|nr:STAS domain-containing protein [Nocardia brasiliensis]AFU02528.1 anti sigma factor antagonist [Nocardia brasiliensis ATCC 700358]
MTDYEPGIPPPERTARPAGTWLTTAREMLDGVAVVRVGGEIDVLTAPKLATAIDDAQTTDTPHALIVDLSEVTFMASSGLTVLAAGAQPNPRGTRLVVVASHPATLRPMQLTGLTDLLSVYPTVAEARAALRTTPAEPSEDRHTQAEQSG